MARGLRQDEMAAGDGAASGGAGSSGAGSGGRMVAGASPTKRLRSNTVEQDLSSLSDAFAALTLEPVRNARDRYNYMHIFVHSFPILCGFF